MRVPIPPRAAALVAACALAAACARDVRATYPAHTFPGEPTGTIVLSLTRPAPDVHVSVNGRLVVEGAHTSRIRIEQVPTGYAELAIAIGPGEKQVQVWVEADGETVLPIGSPGGSPTDSLKSMALSLAAVALYAWIR